MVARQEVWGRRMDSNLAPALSAHAESVWGFFFAKFFRLGRTVLTNLAPALSVYTESVWGFFYAKFFLERLRDFFNFARPIYPIER